MEVSCSPKGKVTLIKMRNFLNEHLPRNDTALVLTSEQEPCGSLTGVPLVLRVARVVLRCDAQAQKDHVMAR